MNWVEELQKLLGLVPDGAYGEVTHETVLEKIKDPEYQVPPDKPPAPPAPPPTRPLFEVINGILYQGGNPVEQRESPNISERQTDKSLIVIHYTGDNGEGGLEWLCSSESRVSAHLWISKKGKVIQLVNFEDKAWHAGVSSWDGHQIGNSVNSFSIGIENQGTGSDWPEAQVQANIDVVIALHKAYKIQGTVGHEDVAPGRKVDPGPNYPWERVYDALGKAGF